ncbi:hypothetical protein COZ61_02075 [Candidatus Berkelbacteria bacterium CG_4_8_14_3_um_filter_33_6]|uniref:Uncharacterized protein n=1 Tax=Candidatus Berkelbacteria bacterium CG_4_10_14_0_2_um_filter_35_9_33_12 TaxID=1974499 RepID=A0A2M7W3E4_9BACT|nr:MAG: hypothetical protein COX10_02350 [Candidatus Berkelbacteria bacterium CG23_combo_of_CG06-09_8_20_14_all_33_15]PIS08251.1 MAG: hypothetical protein COT76_02460 [Candidatus Berkelbacteria bacterium CG10_big_fil_rev_8_21_14_0_10_33_10]PIX31006.1 MAG: hypothetical protein COZ61_02075 [Candidatus Berkelbacteria bacterium CG_4_8_14_3_um_filter_33_6]PIZ28477.1 MAG: hypothetical protein COY43_00270 [Candidatus Berkelbacteria bacterium CG_4_10_14_0_8_um_filter_35_9_33_8]PJA19971.1 MAG: hypotheti
MKHGPEQYRSASENLISKIVKIAAVLTIPLASPSSKTSAETTTTKTEYRIPGLIETIKNNRIRTTELIKKNILQGNEIKNKVIAPESMSQLLELATQSDAPKNLEERQKWTNVWTQVICGDFASAIKTKINMGFTGVIPIGTTEPGEGLVINTAEGINPITNEKVVLEDMDLIVVGFDGSPQSGYINEKKFWLLGIDITMDESGKYSIKQNPIKDLSLNLTKREQQ